MLLLLAQAAPANYFSMDAVLAQTASLVDTLAEDTPWLTEVVFLGSELWRWLALLMTVGLALAIGRLVSGSLLRAADRAERGGQSLFAVTLAALARSTGIFAFALSLPLATNFLLLSEYVANLVNEVNSVLFICALGYAAYTMVDVADAWMRGFSSRTASRMDDMLGPLISRILRTTIVIMVLVQVATILSDKPATSIIAGLGVGGLAIGLAAQDTIKNVFGSLMIFGDRPFELGDTITVDSNTGTVEAVGFRSTRFRTDQGFLISIPNGDLASKSIINISRRRNLVRNFTLALSPTTTPEKLAEALEIIKQILTDHEGMLPSLPPRVTFTDISPTAYSVQVIYWYHPPDARKFAAFGEQVNLQILSRFRDAEIGLAGVVPALAAK